MTKRAHLQDLTRQLGRYLKWQRAHGTGAYRPAGEAMRQALAAKKKALQQRQVQALKAGISGGDEGAAHRPGPTGPKAPATASESQAPRQAPAQPITATTPLWKKHRAIHELDREKHQRAAPTLPPKPPAKPTTPAQKMAFLHHYLSDCQRCPLHQGRTHLVFGDGDPQARLMFIGEGPGVEEDRQGRPFVGRPGRLLTKMIGAMGLSRQEVYITTMVKCRPPKNRDPAPLEVQTCAPFLQKQIEVLAPEVIVTLGPSVTAGLLESDQALGELRGRWQEYLGVAVMPTYHPAYLVRHEDDRQLRGAAWRDLQMVMKRLGLQAGE